MSEFSDKDERKKYETMGWEKKKGRRRLRITVGGGRR